MIEIVAMIYGIVYFVAAQNAVSTARVMRSKSDRVPLWIIAAFRLSTGVLFWCYVLREAW